MAKSKILSARRKATYDKLVKQANQRLRELEKHGYTNAGAYAHMERISYDSDKLKTTTRTKKGQLKFRTDIAKMAKEPSLLKELIKEVKQFLKAETSTVRGVKKIHEKNYNKFKEYQEQGDADKITFNEYLDLWNNEVIKQSFKYFDSDQIVEMYNTAKSYDLSNTDFIDIMRDHMEESMMSIYEAMDELRAKYAEERAQEKDFMSNPQSKEDYDKMKNKFDEFVESLMRSNNDDMPDGWL